MNKTHDITNEVVTDYINQYYEPLNDNLAKLRLEAEENNVPIIVKETETFLRTFFEIYRPTRVLEIGTAVGYSASIFAFLLTDSSSRAVSTPENRGKVFLRRKALALQADTNECEGDEREPKAVYTLERDDEMYEKAISNVEKLGLKDEIEIMHGDAIESLRKLKEDGEKFDFLFIDAAKSHYKEFLDEALPLMVEGSVIIADNTIFRGRVASDEYDLNGKYKTNIKKLREYNEYVMKDPRFISTIQAIGDGLTITKLL